MIDVRSLIQVFDKENKGTVDRQTAKTILRGYGILATEKALNDVLAKHDSKEQF